MTTTAIRIPAPPANRFFPEADCLTIEEYHRLASNWPAPLQPRPARRRIGCAHCGELFTPHPVVQNPRFCSSPCRRKFHARQSRLRKRAA